MSNNKFLTIISSLFIIICFSINTYAITEKQYLIINDLIEQENIDKAFEDLKIFQKGTELPDMNLTIKEDPVLRREGDVPKCSSYGYNFPCSTNMTLKENAEQIDGNSDEICCEYDLKKLLNILPILFGIIIFLIALYRKSLLLFSSALLTLVISLISARIFEFK